MADVRLQEGSTQHPLSLLCHKTFASTGLREPVGCPMPQCRVESRSSPLSQLAWAATYLRGPRRGQSWPILLARGVKSQLMLDTRLGQTCAQETLYKKWLSKEKNESNSKL